MEALPAKTTSPEVAEFAGPAEVLGQPQGQARASGQQRQIAAGGPEGVQVLIAEGIGDRHPHALGAQFGDFLADLQRSLSDAVVAQQTDLLRGLRLQHTDQVGVGHGGQRMVLHA